MSRKQPHPNTLHAFAKQAEHDYQQHLRAVEKNERFVHAPLGAAALAGAETLSEKGNPGWKEGEDSKAYDVRISQGRVKGNLERATEHYKQNNGAYTELGIVEAHLDGVKINVEQPITIGEKIEVHRYDDPDIT